MCTSSFVYLLIELYAFSSDSGQFVNMVNAGIIDPLKVIRTALVDAARLATLFISSLYFLYIASVNIWALSLQCFTAINNHRGGHC